jgi:hypothetical protein
MKKVLSTLLIATAAFGSAYAISADQTIIGTDTADVQINGTLGADNTDPGTTIPEGNKDWINVTLPTDTIFYNKATSATATPIKAPTYNITNNSGRPVKVTATGFTGTNTALPTDFDLNLTVASLGGLTPTTATTALVENGVLKPTLNSELITLANKEGKLTATGAVAANSNKATFTYTGEATAATALKVAYTLTLKFDVPTNFK